MKLKVDVLASEIAQTYCGKRRNISFSPISTMVSMLLLQNSFLSYIKGLTLYHISGLLMTLKYKACNHNFILFPQCFLPYQRQKSTF